MSLEKKARRDWFKLQQKKVMKNGGNSFLPVKLVKHKEILGEVPVPGRRILDGKGQIRFAVCTGVPCLFLSHCWL